jgi:putative oxidoreductase
MTANRLAQSLALESSVAMLVRQVFDWLDHVPYWLLAIPLRLAVATVFWDSAMAHLASWETTLTQFAEDYQVPLLPPTVAAYMAVSIEVSTPILLVLGLFTRFAALVPLGMVTVIEVFVYPEAWPAHIQWAAMLLVLLCRGAGTLSVDHVIKHYLLPHE